MTIPYDHVMLESSSRMFILARFVYYAPYRALSSSPFLKRRLHSISLQASEISVQQHTGSVLSRTCWGHWSKHEGLTR